MRRLNHAIVEYQQGRLRDDATAALIEWQPDQPALFSLPGAYSLPAPGEASRVRPCWPLTSAPARHAGGGRGAEPR